MLTFYTIENNHLKQLAPKAAKKPAVNVVWIDMLSPTKQEETQVELLLGINVPTRDEMHKLEVSSRLYQENGTLYTNFSIVTKADSTAPEIHAISLILTKKTLITLRYSEPKAFELFLLRHQQALAPKCSAACLCVDLLETIIDREAHILSQLGMEIDKDAQALFQPKSKGMALNLQAALKKVGANGALLSKLSESLTTISRLLHFTHHSGYFKPNSSESRKLSMLNSDVVALNDHAIFLANKVSFLLDATLGLISNEQNATIKIFSVAAVIFLPPTLVASIYGMNFRHMPELEWEYGYPMAITLMVISMFLAIAYFKRKKWL